VYTAQPLGVLSSWLNTFHIYGFTLVSGYLFYALKYEKGKYEKYLPFIANKCKRLLLPYVFVSLVWAIPFGVFFFRYGAMDILKQYALGTAPSQLWFLLMLFGVARM
jgi:fucose 4-O-acetylase-like acetyltransferase